MNSKSYLHIFVAKFFSKSGTVLSRCKCYSVAISCYHIAMKINPRLDRWIQIANAFMNRRKYKEAAKYYKKAFKLQSNLMNFYFDLGLNHFAKKGRLNDEFYQSSLDLVETPEIISMIKILTRSQPVYQPSKFWLFYMWFHIYQIETVGVENFKRTINNNYFNWTNDYDINAQMKSLKNELNWSDSDMRHCETSVKFNIATVPKEYTEEKWKKYGQFLCLLWEYTLKNDHLKILNQLQESLLGNPIAIEYKGHKVTQDICNSVIEINTIMEFINYNPEKKLRVMELGAGYGRVGSVLLHAVPNIQIVIVDIAPALYVSQWYLTNLFPKYKVFKFRDFSDYNDVQQEFEESSIAFLLPAQIEYMPDQMFDLFINISSLHEMTPTQIEMWYGQIDRVCKGWFYTKQYIKNINNFDGVVIRREDYPVRPNWQELLNRRSQVFSELFEAIYKLH